jgi:hypothetical protein
VPADVVAAAMRSINVAPRARAAPSAKTPAFGVPCVATSPMLVAALEGHATAIVVQSLHLRARHERDVALGERAEQRGRRVGRGRNRPPER